MKDKIFDEIRRKNLKKNAVWRFQEYNPFKYSLNPIEQDQFYECMSQLCEEGIFIAEKYGSVLRYRLTEKGENEIYVNRGN